MGHPAEAQASLEEAERLFAEADKLKSRTHTSPDE